jgi:hypothetical protein
VAAILVAAVLLVKGAVPLIAQLHIVRRPLHR